MDIAIFGAGGFGREVELLINDINAHSVSSYNLIGYFDDKFQPGTLFNGYPILGGIKELNAWSDDLALVLAVGNSLTRKRIYSEILNKNITYPSLIHPRATVNIKYNFIGKGVVICEGTILTCNIHIGDFVLINLQCTVGHDAAIESFASLMPGVNVSGNVKINSAVFIGTGAKIINNVEIGENSIIGAGAVVSKNIPANCTAVGVPARPLNK
ncbi:transferase [Thermaurantimonas aggregans]|uniref:Transferase n=1 Tax=Thermaurantimonas aggregans TaxID=2173829 RepID=A0A401XJX9_9FLAO|nr:acetyltransferase [Thermaurantimonas aggregans]MCX8148613.1 acetyltransferase [Thermaurantimonas aggregans]GCD77318.1 transferase [Thermaurantimonas aggregans]